MSLKKKTLMIAGGGTGGHILPGVAVAEQWKKKFSNESHVVFIGAKGALEEKLVPHEGYPLYLLNIRGLNRVSSSQKLKTLLMVPLSLLQSAHFLLKERPQWVLGVGGYASGPMLFIASTIGRLIGVKTAILEPNSVPGMANKILSHFVDRIYVSFENTKKYFKQKSIIYIGTPTRSKLSQLDSKPTSPLTVFIFGGSQGAAGVNHLVLNSIKYFKEMKDQIQFIHQTGKKDFEKIKNAYKEAGLSARVEEFITDMGSSYSVASLVVCRSGASTLAELALTKKPSILIPLPTAADNHQYKNAKDFADVGAAILLEQNKTTPKEFFEAIVTHINQPEKLAQMSKQLEVLSKPNAAESLVKDLNS